MTSEKVVGWNYCSQGIAQQNYTRARRARSMMPGALPPKNVASTAGL